VEKTHSGKVNKVRRKYSILCVYPGKDGYGRVLIPSRLDTLGKAKEIEKKHLLILPEQSVRREVSQRQRSQN